MAYLNARLIDADADYDGPGGLVTEGGRILDAGVGVTADALGEDVARVDCGGAALCAGLIDLMAFCDEPGDGARESFESLGAAAIAGGVTTVALMPETAPPLDEPALVELVARKSRTECAAHLAPLAAMTRGFAGADIAEYGLMRAAGAAAFTDGFSPGPASDLMRRLMDYAAGLDVLIAPIARDPALMAGAVAWESEFATRAGLVAAPAIVERLGLERDLALAALTGCRYHAACVATAAGAEAVDRAKDQAPRVTAAAPVSHLFFNETDAGSLDSRFRLDPPLPREEDRAALAQALAGGAIDALVSGHRPRLDDEKRAPFAEAAPGGAMIELLLPAALSLYYDHEVPLIRVIDALTRAPADILGLDAGRLAPGAPADFVLIDLDRPFVCACADLNSKAPATPFEGRRLQGRVLKTVIGGRVVYESDS